MVELYYKVTIGYNPTRTSPARAAGGAAAAATATAPAAAPAPPERAATVPSAAAGVVFERRCSASATRSDAACGCRRHFKNPF